MRSPATTKHITAANCKQWDASAKYHEQSDQWSALKLGFAEKSYSVLDDIVSAALTSAGVDDAKLVQIECNNGRKILSTFSLGARRGWGWINRSNFYNKPKHCKPSLGITANFYVAISMHCQIISSRILTSP